MNLSFFDSLLSLQDDAPGPELHCVALASSVFSAREVNVKERKRTAIVISL